VLNRTLAGAGAHEHNASVWRTVFVTKSSQLQAKVPNFDAVTPHPRERQCLLTVALRSATSPQTQSQSIRAFGPVKHALCYE
jgi:hypothetical protein